MARLPHVPTAWRLYAAACALLTAGGAALFTVASFANRTPSDSPDAEGASAAASVQPENSTESYPRRLLAPRRLDVGERVVPVSLLQFDAPPLPGRKHAEAAETMPANDSNDPWQVDEHAREAVDLDSDSQENALPDLNGPQVGEAQPPARSSASLLRRLPQVDEVAVQLDEDATSTAPSRDAEQEGQDDGPRRLPPVEEETHLVRKAITRLPALSEEVIPEMGPELLIEQDAPEPPFFEDAPEPQGEEDAPAPGGENETAPADEDEARDARYLPGPVANGDGKASPGFDVSKLAPDNQVLPAAPVEQSPAPPRIGRRGRPGPDPALAAVSAQAMQTIRHGFSLADRGAIYSARAQFIQGLRMIAQALDAADGVSSHSEALAQGMRALEEVDDFVPRGSRVEADMDVASIVASHRTPIFHDADPPAALVALQRYYTYAQNKLADAAGNVPAGSMALYGLGKIHALQPDQTPEQRRLNAPKAMALQHAALTVDGRNFEAANELGVLLAHYGQLHDARGVILHGLSQYPTPALWHNLSIVHQRLGEVDLARRAQNECRIALQKTPGRSLTSPIEWVSPEEFAQTMQGGIELPLQRSRDGAASNAMSRRSGTPGGVGRSLWSAR